MADPLREYLIRLGFAESDSLPFSKFDSLLARAEVGVTRHTGGMARTMLETQGAIVGAFTGISGAILGVVDKSAMMDQFWRLSSQKMMMSIDSARKYDLITKTLGADLGQIWRDPELHARADEMSKRLDKMFGGLDERQLKRVRDFRQELKMLTGPDLTALGQHFTVSLIEKLFPGEDGIEKLKGFVSYFEDHIGEISDKLATRAVPILKDTWKIMLGLGEAVKSGAVAFTDLVGLFSGDTSIQGKKFSFDNLATAIEHVTKKLTEMVNAFSDAEKKIGHTGSAISLLLHGDVSGAGKEAGKVISGETVKDPLTGENRQTPGLGLNASTLAYLILGKWLLGKGIGLGKWVGKASGLSWLAGKGVGLLGGGEAAAAEGAATLTGMSVTGAGGATTTVTLGPTVAASGVGTAVPAVVAAASILAVPIAAGVGLYLERSHVKSFSEWKFSDSPLGRLLGIGTSASSSKGASVGGTGGASLTNSLFDAISRYEKASSELNNPGNLRAPGGGPIRQFSTLEEGIGAGKSQVDRNIGRGLTLNEFFAGKKGVYPGWAPKADKNNPAAYAAWVASQLGIDPNTPLNQLAANYMNRASASAAMPQGAASGPAQQDVHVNVGGVYITQPGATPEQIQRCIEGGICDALDNRERNVLAQLQWAR